MQFRFVDQFMWIRMDVDPASLRRGRVTVVESARRLHSEKSYGFIHSLWWIWAEDGRSAASVPPGAGPAIRKVLEDVRDKRRLLDPELAERLKAPVNDASAAAGVQPVDRVLRDVVFACNARLLRRHNDGHCRRLTDATIPPAEGIRLPTHCFPDGIVYGVVADGTVASVAYAHRTGCMEDRVADLGVECAPAYRRRGYAKTAVSSVVAHITALGGQARYGCSPDNAASLATARSVGFTPYGTSLILSAPLPA